MRLIDADALKKEIDKELERMAGYIAVDPYVEIAVYIKCINEAPTVDLSHKV